MSWYEYYTVGPNYLSHFVFSFFFYGDYKTISNILIIFFYYAIEKLYMFRIRVGIWLCIRENVISLQSILYNKRHIIWIKDSATN